MCGCGDGIPLFRFPGPKGVIYALHAYPGCVDCEAPAGVIIIKYQNKTEAAAFDVMSMKEMEFSDGQAAFQIADPKKIINNLCELCGDAVLKEDPTFTVKELLTDIEEHEAQSLVLQGVF